MRRVPAFLLSIAVLLTLSGVSGAQVATPNFIDQAQRGAAAQTVAPPARIRFLTSVDFPPFSFLDSRGLLTGFNVDLARAVCEDMAVTDVCQIEARPFAELEPALLAGEGEAIIAGVAIDAASRTRLAFTRTYLHFPARFAALAGSALGDDLPASLDGQRVAVVSGTAHAAMLAAFFPAAVAVPVQNASQGLSAMRRGDAAAYFGDGIGLSFWLASEAAADCCRFVGGPYLSDRYLGEGLAFALAPDDQELAARFDEALRRVVASGRFSELMLRYFPVSAF
ncbi:transporter substrate-binding domain-containing protein [Aureimonas altamirensis]|uniref:transporter substrate-binding domain-containing protein n=1 Tax=Aureimonas altamirensis TaxID=370622 RepID=UPI003019087E